MVRLRLAYTYLRPLWTWGAPIVTPPPTATAKLLARAVWRTQNTWWCLGRWWCQNIMLHPVYSCSLFAFRRLHDEKLIWSSFLENSIQVHAQTLGLEYIRFSEERGVLLEVSSMDDFRVLQIVEGLADAQLRFWTHSKRAQHVLRVIARIRCLQIVEPRRKDAEEVESVDVDACSNKIFTKWFHSLSIAEKFSLSVYRSGAASSETRRQTGLPCPHCGHLWPSIRHQVVECPHWDGLRADLSSKYILPPTFWTSLPRVSAKSGWITYAADPASNVRRATMLRAVCEMGIGIIGGGLEGRLHDPAPPPVRRRVRVAA